MDFKSSAELKSLARERLKGNYGIAVGVYLIVAFISLFIDLIVLLLYRDTSVSTMIMMYLFNLIITLLMAVFSMGVTKFFLNLSRKDRFQLNDLLWGFSHHPDKVIIVTLLYIVAVIGTMLPYIIFILIYVASNNLVSLLLALLSILLAGIAIILLLLNYSLVYFILADNPEKSSIYALRESRILMRGHKGKLFYITLSFIGLYLLGILSCFIGFLWILPYAQVTMCHFYMDVRGELQLPKPEDFTGDPFQTYQV